MHPNARLLTQLYTGLIERDFDAMAACYAPDAQFANHLHDLKGPAILDLWRMLCARDLGLELDFTRIEADDQYGLADLVLSYRQPPRNQPVRQPIEAIFEFHDGRIIRHHDHYDAWRWAAQALGLRGRLLGWSRPVQHRARRQARADLDAWQAQRSS